MALSRIVGGTAPRYYDGAAAQVRMPLSAKSDVVLELQEEKDLVGSITFTGAQGHDMKLKKVE